MTRYYRRRFGRMRTKRKFQWIRDTSVSNAPATPFNLDLLSSFRTKFGISLNLPDIVIYRIHIKVAITIAISSFSPDTGVLYSVFNEDQNISPASNLVDPYQQRYLMWDRLLVAEQEVQSASTATPTLYHEYDIKARRKFQNIEETLYTQTVLTGNATSITQISHTWSVLLRLP